jgi:deoxyribonuclease-4
LVKLVRIINHPLLKAIPFYLETPKELDGFIQEKKYLKSKREEC